MAAARSGTACTLWRIHPVSTARRRIAARRITPVSPIPPTVQAKRSEFSSREARVTRPSGPITSIQSVNAPKPPSTWWFLPCTSAAMAPPSVTKRVPGVTAGTSRAAAARR